MRKQIVITKQFISRKDSLVRLNTMVREEGNEYTLWCEVNEEDSIYLTENIADHIIYLTLSNAMRGGCDIISAVPMSRYFYHNLTEILIPTLARGDKRLHKINIYAPLVDVQFQGKEVGTAVTCGVDSTYTILQYTKKDAPIRLSALIITPASCELYKTKVQDLNHWQSEYARNFENYESIAHETGLPLKRIFSNYTFYTAHWSKYIAHNLFLHIYLTMAHIIVLKKMFKVYLFSSSVPFQDFSLENNAYHDCAYYDLLSAHILTTPDFIVYNAGGEASRYEKHVCLLDYPLAQKYLHPCFSNNKNCSQAECPKCLRSLLVLDLHNKLESFCSVFDIEHYNKHKLDFLVELSSQKNNKYLFELYEPFKNKYPNEMKRADKIASYSIIESYMEFCKRIADSVLILIVVYDTANDMANSRNLCLNTIGLNMNNQITYRKNYAACVANGTIIFEESNQDVWIEKAADVGDKHILLKSVRYDKNACHDVRSKIEIDGFDYCLKRRGINIVIYDTHKSRLIDNVAFDVWQDAAVCHRNAKLYHDLEEDIII